MKSNKVELVNWYEKMPKHLLLKANNPNFKLHKMNIPFRLLIIGCSSAGKTSTMINILKIFSQGSKGTFHRLIYVTKNSDEPLLNMLKLQLGNQIEILEGIENIPLIDSFNKDLNNLIIFDDLVLEKNLKSITPFFIRGRKLNISCVFISQIYCSKNEDFKTIRKNSSYIILKKVSSNRDLLLILNEFSLGIDKKDFINLYENIIKNFNDFLMIDINASSDEKFRHNFDVINLKKELV